MAGFAITITSSQGRLKRLAGDEPDATDVPLNLTFGTSLPGGFKDCTFNLQRLAHQTEDLDLFDHVRVYAPGNVTVWEGRIVQLPRKHTDTLEVGVGCVGWSSHLLDDPSFVEVYCDRDLSRWGEPSRARQLALIASNFNNNPPRATMADATNSLPALGLVFQGRWESPAKPACEVLYDAGPGVEIGAIYYDPAVSSTVTLPGTWNIQLLVAESDDTTGSETSGDIEDAFAADYFEPTDPARYGVALFRNDATPGGVHGTEYSLTVRKLTVYGNHGLTRQGTTDPQGFYLSDIVADLVSRTAPLLNYTTGEGGSIETNQFVVTHLTYTDPVTGDEALQRANVFALWEWGVYDDREFFWRQPDPDRLTWQLRLDQGVHLDNEGEDADGRYNGVIVFYQDPAGVRRIAGPTGAGFDVESDDLLDTSETNPVNSHGISRRWGKLQIDFPCDDDSATQLGRVWLAEHSIPQHRGQAIATGTAVHPTKGERPVHEIRSGDYAQFTDDTGASSVARRIIDTRYVEATDQNTLSLGNTVWKLDAILARMGVRQVGVL